jgi:hypothetical protein
VIAALGLALALQATPADRPRLVVTISVDQMIPEQLERLRPWLKGGLGRFANDGLVFPNAALRHGDTETGPGHASFGTGLHPTHHGIVSNDWFVFDSRDSMYCFGDAHSKAVTSAGLQEARASSPRNLRVEGLADFVEAASANAKTFAISSKDRSAIGMTGQHADLALWWDKNRGGFMTSSWYASALPEWVVTWNSGWQQRLPFAGEWRAELPEHFEGSGTAPDERDGEWGKPGQRSFPHATPKRGANLTDKELAALASWVYDSAPGDVMVLELAREAVAKLELGADDVTDLLAISLSSCDTVGHAYGPLSVEVTDVLLRADRELGKLFDLLDERVGRGRWIAALSADHGVLELPETLAAQGYPSERLSGRVIGDAIKSARNSAALKFGQDFYLSSSARGVRLSVSAMKAAGVEPKSVREHYAAELRESGRAWIEHALTYDELEAIARHGAPASGLVAMEANSFFEERSADVVLLQKAWCLAALPVGTTHGTPYPYDRAVPLAFYGPGFRAGRDFREAASVDALPTLLARLGIATAANFDGRDLLADH